MLRTFQKLFSYPERLVLMLFYPGSGKCFHLKPMPLYYLPADGIGVDLYYI